MVPHVIRPGHAGDITSLRRIFSAASHGLAEVFWEADRKPGETLGEVAARRLHARVGDPANAFWMAEVFGTPAGGILSYDIDEREPLDGLSPMLRSFVAFENDAVGTRYVNVLAVFPEFQRRGIASALLAQAVRDAAGRPVSLAVADVNTGARKTYAANGFDEVGRYPMVKEGWDGEGKNWILMIRK